MSEHMIGHMYDFPKTRSPGHVNQAHSFLDALNAVIAPLGRNTDICDNFDELRKRHGFSKKQLMSTFSSLEQVPDILEILDLWLKKIESSNYGFMEITAIKISATSFYQRQVGGSLLQIDEDLIEYCDNYISENKPGTDISEYVFTGYKKICRQFNDLKKSDIEAQLLIRAITICVSQI